MVRVNFHQFNGNSERDWLEADINGFIYTWVAFMFILCVIMAGMSEWLNPLLEEIKNNLGQNSNIQVVLLGVAVLSVAPAFIVVFIARRNFTVIGPRRQFRYFCRWL